MSNRTKCPVCGTFYMPSPVHLVAECGGEGKCPARVAGKRPTANHVLCACNRAWVLGNRRNGIHGYDDCDYAI